MENNNRDRRNRPGRSGKERGTIILVAALACIAVVALGIVGVQALRRNKVEDMYTNLAEETWTEAQNTTDVVETPAPTPEHPEELTEPEEEPGDILEELGVPILDKVVDFAQLQEETNDDIYAWIYIPDADNAIDYPVLQHPTDNTYYLNHNPDGSSGYPGCIYTENYNATDFSDPVTVMYGHNMKNGSMFAGLHKFEDSEYFEEHPYIYIYTEDKLLVYEVFAAYVSDDKHILFSYNSCQEYLQTIPQNSGANANVREDVTVTAQDKILTLSTCIANQGTKRYLVQGVLLNEE